MRGISEWHFEVWEYSGNNTAILIDNGVVFGRNLLEIKKLTTQLSETQDFKGRWQKVSKTLYIKFRHRRRDMSKELENPYAYPHIRLEKVSTPNRPKE